MTVWFVVGLILAALLGAAVTALLITRNLPSIIAGLSDPALDRLDRTVRRLRANP